MLLAGGIGGTKTNLAVFSSEKGWRAPGAEATFPSAVHLTAPASGLGESLLTWDGSRYRAHPSKAGHADFAPANSFQIELLRYLLTRFPHVSFERVCSVKGLPNIYDFLKDSGYAEE